MKHGTVAAALLAALVGAATVACGGGASRERVWKDLMRDPGGTAFVPGIAKDGWSPALPAWQGGKTTLGEVLAHRYSGRGKPILSEYKPEKPPEWAEGKLVWALYFGEPFWRLDEAYPLKSLSLWFTTPDDGVPSPTYRKEAVLEYVRADYYSGVSKAIPADGVLRTLGKPMRVVRVESPNEWWVYAGHYVEVSVFHNQHTGKNEITLSKVFLGVEPTVARVASQWIGHIHKLVHQHDGKVPIVGSTKTGRWAPNTCAASISCPSGCSCIDGICRSFSAGSGSNKCSYWVGDAEEPERD